MKTIQSVHPKPSLAKLFSGNTTDAKKHQQVIKQTQRLVSNTFFGTILKQMHESPFKSKIFDGGRGGEAFGSLLDQHLADRMAAGAGSKLVNAMVKAIEHPRTKGNQPGAPVNPDAARMLLKKSGYSKSPAVNRRPYVATDKRA